MAHAETMFKDNFLKYASYVITDRTIPDIVDGFKPVQRRIIHSLLEMDDGKFQKVANVVGYAMRYHPHGDASIYGALVNLANFGYFIDRQGNFGNQLTGDGAAAARYIECRILPFAKKVLFDKTHYDDEITEFVDSYDGRNREPVVFPAKLPIVLMQGCEGIAVGMKTVILPHNPLEIIDAMEKALNGDDFVLYPDFFGGGILDVNDYDDGRGSVSVRARLDVSDPKKIVITELPFGVTSDAIIEDINKAAKSNKIKISSINDYTGSSVNIEVTLARGAYTKDTVAALYAYTKAEQKIKVNSLVIKDGFPVVMGVTEIVKYHSNHLVEVLQAELEQEKGHLLDKLQMRTLERIFIEERLYKPLETIKTAEEIVKVVRDGFIPFESELQHPITDEEIESLLKLPIRRISLFDLDKNKREILEINKDLRTVNKNLKDIKNYAVAFLEEMRGLLKDNTRRTELQGFDTVDVKQVAKRDLDVKFDDTTGYLGYNVKSGESLLKVSPYDRVLFIQKDGIYKVVDAPDKIFVGKGLQYAAIADKDELQNTVFTAIFQEKTTRLTVIKRFRITAFMFNKAYSILPSNGEYKLLKLCTYPNAELTMSFRQTRGAKEKTVLLSDFLVKAANTNGVILDRREIDKLRLKRVKDDEVSEPESTPNLFGEDK